MGDVQNGVRGVAMDHSERERNVGSPALHSAEVPATLFQGRTIFVIQLNLTDRPASRRQYVQYNQRRKLIASHVAC
jgi:hypothetical protein